MSPSPTAEARNGAPTLASSLTAQLREAILDGRMAPGEKLNLDEMRKNFKKVYSQ